MRNTKSNFFSHKFSQVTPHTKLLFLAILVSGLWLSFAYLLSNNNENYLSDEAVNSRIAELVEVSGDTESPTHIDTPIFDTRLAVALVFVAAFVIRLTQFKQLRSKSAFLYAFSARAPPIQSSR